MHNPVCPRIRTIQGFKIGLGGSTLRQNLLVRRGGDIIAHLSPTPAYKVVTRYLGAFIPYKSISL